MLQRYDRQLKPQQHGKVCNNHPEQQHESNKGLKLKQGFDRCRPRETATDERQLEGRTLARRP